MIEPQRSYLEGMTLEKWMCRNPDRLALHPEAQLLIEQYLIAKEVAVHPIEAMGWDGLTKVGEESAEKQRDAIEAWVDLGPERQKMVRQSFARSAETLRRISEDAEDHLHCSSAALWLLEVLGRGTP